MCIRYNATIPSGLLSYLDRIHDVDHKDHNSKSQMWGVFGAPPSSFIFLVVTSLSKRLGFKNYNVKVENFFSKFYKKISKFLIFKK